MKKYFIDVPTTWGPLKVEMSAKDISDFHNELTIFYNAHFREIEDAINKD